MPEGVDKDMPQDIPEEMPEAQPQGLMARQGSVM